jgi:hypothetical protein
MSLTLERGLTVAECEHFHAHGYVLMKGAFSREFALNEVHEQFAANGMDADRPETWREPRMSLPATKEFSLQELAPRVHAAVHEILGGEERIAGDLSIGNSMIACCSLGEGEPWQAPDENSGWHKDGQFFRHFLDSPEQALLGLPLWSDVVPQGGGTFLAPESVGVMARFLASHPEGVHPFVFPTSELMRQCPQRFEAVGEAGDYFLMHGYMMHSVSPNPHRKLRCISNNVFALNEPMQFNRPDDTEYSLLERGVLRGLGVERYDFQPTRKRLCTPDYSPLAMEFR